MKRIENAIQELMKELGLAHEIVTNLLLNEMFNRDLIEVYSMDDFDYVFSHLKPIELAQKVSFGNIDYNDDYFYLDCCNHIVTIDDINEHLEIESVHLTDENITELVNDIIKNRK